jgi:hypothetical protein
MATLVVKALDVSGTALSGVPVLAKLTDLNGVPLHEFTLTGLLILPTLTHTGSDGVATLELVPNADIQRENTYYTINVGSESPVLILKGSAEETLLASRVVSPLALGPAAVLGDLADVDIAGLASGQALQWNGTKWIPVDWVEGGGGGGAPAAHATSHISGSDQLSDATGITHGLMPASAVTKLSGIAVNATANATDAQLRDRSTHTGTQANTTITGLGTASTQPTSAFEAAGAVAAGISAHAGAVDPHGDRAYADAAVAALISAAPSLLNTLDEIAAALNDDPNFAATMTTALAGKQAAHALLTQISGLTFSANDIIQYVGGVLTNRTMAQLKTALAIAQNDVTGLTAALAALQPADTDLSTIAGLTATTDNLIQSVAGAWASRTPAQLKTTLALVKGDVGLGNVDNTADSAKPVSTSQQAALDLKANILQVLRTISGTSDTPGLTDIGKIMETTNASAVAITLPTDVAVAYPLQTELTWCQAGAGQMTIAAGAGGTLRAPGGAKSRAQWSTIGARKRAANEWVVFGDTTT